MSKALNEIGLGRAIKFLCFELALCISKLLIIPQARVIYLRLLGAKIGKDVTIFDVRFTNCYRRGFAGLEIADNCFIGTDCLLDLADAIVLEKNVTLAARVNVVTHLNVGYKDHPLQMKFPSMSKGVTIKDIAVELNSDVEALGNVQFFEERVDGACRIFRQCGFFSINSNNHG